MGDAYSRRDSVIRLSRTDFARAFDEAHEITFPWLRAQGFAWVARFAPESEFEMVIRCAIGTLDETDDKRAAMAGGWVLRALVERSDLDGAERLAAYVIDRANSVRRTLARSDALYPGWFATLEGGRMRPDAWALRLGAAALHASAVAHGDLAVARVQDITAGLQDVAGEDAIRLRGRGMHFLQQICDGERGADTARRLGRRMFAIARTDRFECWLTPRASVPAVHRIA